MVDAISSAGCFAPTKNPTQILKERAEQRKIVREEMRYDALKEKEKNNELTPAEEFELSCLRFGKALESFVENPPVVYIA